MSVRSRTGGEGARPRGVGGTVRGPGSGEGKGAPTAPGALTERPVHATGKKRSDRSSDIPLTLPSTGARTRRRPTAWREGQNASQNSWSEDAATCRPEGCSSFFCLPY